MEERSSVSKKLNPFHQKPVMMMSEPIFLNMKVWEKADIRQLISPTQYRRAVFTALSLMRL